MVVLICISLMASDVEHFFHVLIGCLCIFMGQMFILCPFVIGLLLLLLLSYMTPLYILNTGPIPDT